MKNLNLKVIGVQEMNHSELVQTEGGLGFIAVAIVAVVVAVASSCCNDNRFMKIKRMVETQTRILYILVSSRWNPDPLTPAASSLTRDILTAPRLFEVRTKGSTQYSDFIPTSDSCQGLGTAPIRRLRRPRSSRRRTG